MENLAVDQQRHLSEPPFDRDPPFTVQPDNIVRILSRSIIRKAAGPDQITPRLLRNCASQLADVFAHIFNWSLRVCRLPKCYKDSIIVPVPKKKAIKSLNDYGTVALTSDSEML